MNATTHIRGFIGYAFISNRRWFFLIGMQLVSLLPFPQSFLKEELGKKKECLSIKKKTAQFEKALLIWKKKKNVSGTEAIPPLSSWNRWLHFSVRLFFTVQKFPGRLFRNAENIMNFYSCSLQQKHSCTWDDIFLLFVNRRQAMNSHFEYYMMHKCRRSIHW